MKTITYHWLCETCGVHGSFVAGPGITPDKAQAIAQDDHDETGECKAPVLCKESST